MEINSWDNKERVLKGKANGRRGRAGNTPASFGIVELKGKMIKMMHVFCETKEGGKVRDREREIRTGGGRDREEKGKKREKA